MSKPTVAIVGSSADRSKFGNKSVRAHLQSGWEVFPVNPRGGEIEGLPVYRSMKEVPATKLNRVSMYVIPAVGLQVLEQLATKGCEELWLNPGSESPDLFQRALELELNPILGCSIISLGVRPTDFPDT